MSIPFLNLTQLSTLWELGSNDWEKMVDCGLERRRESQGARSGLNTTETESQGGIHFPNATVVCARFVTI